ncbi:MAG: hypothetical protein ABIJ97_16345 [Bacteroidota bacterium]
MKAILIFTFLIITICIYGQQTNSTKTGSNDTIQTVSFISDFNMNEMAAKDGYIINGYIVDLSLEQAKMFDGKKIKVTGQYTIIIGLENQPKEYDENGNIIYKQGRLNDIKYISSPTIDIIDKEDNE